MDAPPPSVLAAFDAPSGPVRLPGGQGTSWRAGDVVLKPLDMAPEALAWQERVLSSLSPSGFRVAVPRRSRGGALVVEGWTAWPALDGVHEPRWSEIAAAGERLHEALSDVARPSTLLAARTDPWARADRVTWGETPPPDGPSQPALAALLALRAPIRAHSQVVHGDLTGNVLFADGLDPAIIDLSPYWRPKGFASAVVAVDAMAWHGADASVLTHLVDGEDRGQLLLRALLFRLLSDPGPMHRAHRYQAVIDAVTRLIDP